MSVQVRGPVFVGTRTPQAAAMSEFLGEVSATQRYVHFRAPDGRLYELVEPR